MENVFLLFQCPTFNVYTKVYVSFKKTLGNFWRLYWLNDSLKNTGIYKNNRLQHGIYNQEETKLAGAQSFFFFNAYSTCIRI